MLPSSFSGKYTKRYLWKFQRLQNDVLLGSLFSILGLNASSYKLFSTEGES